MLNEDEFQEMNKMLHTCFVLDRLQITKLPLFFTVRIGKFPLGFICSDVPKHNDKSAFLKKIRNCNIRKY